MSRLSFYSLHDIHYNRSVHSKLLTNWRPVVCVADDIPTWACGTCTHTVPLWYLLNTNTSQTIAPCLCVRQHMSTHQDTRQIPSHLESFSSRNISEMSCSSRNVTKSAPQSSLNCRFVWHFVSETGCHYITAVLTLEERERELGTMRIMRVSCCDCEFNGML